jgi:hypothetical protein
LGESQLPFYLGRVGVNYWVVPITIGKKSFRKIAGALFSYQLSQYDSWIGDWGLLEML